MAQTPEGRVKADVRKLLDEFGIYHFMPAANGFGRAGIFDFVCCVRGVFLGIECKRDAKTAPTELQTREAKRVRHANGIVFLANGVNITELKALINQIQEKEYGTHGQSFWPFDSAPTSDKW